MIFAFLSNEVDSGTVTDPLGHTEVRGRLGIGDDSLETNAICNLV